MAHPYQDKRESERAIGKERFKKSGGDTSCMPKRAHGGGIPMKGGAETGQGRLDKAKAYNAKRG